MARVLAVLGLLAACGTSSVVASERGLLVALPPSPTFTCAAGNDATQCAALGDLYYSTGGSSWSSKSGWTSAASGTATNYCTFIGVVCVGNNVTQLCAHFHVLLLVESWLILYCRVLNNNQLSGTIPSTMGNLARLQKLCVPRGSAGRRLGRVMLRLGVVCVAGSCMATG